MYAIDHNTVDALRMAGVDVLLWYFEGRGGEGFIWNFGFPSGAEVAFATDGTIPLHAGLEGLFMALPAEAFVLPPGVKSYQVRGLCQSLMHDSAPDWTSDPGSTGYALLELRTGMVTIITQWHDGWVSRKIQRQAVAVPHTLLGALTHILGGTADVG